MRKPQPPSPELIAARKKAAEIVALRERQYADCDRDTAARGMKPSTAEMCKFGMGIVLEFAKKDLANLHGPYAERSLKARARFQAKHPQALVNNW